MHREAAYPWWRSYPVSRVCTCTSPLSSTPGDSRRIDEVVEKFRLDEWWCIPLWFWAPFIPKLIWFHYEEYDSHLLVDTLSERWCSQQPAKNRNAIPITTLNAVKIVSHTRYELKDDVECKMRWFTKAGMDLNIRSLLWRTLNNRKACTNAHTFSKCYSRTIIPGPLSLVTHTPS